MAEPYDPLNYGNLARSIVRAMLEREGMPLPPTESFDGSGVYALYYTGDFGCYADISSAELEIPIYVGKAIPAGGRKGGHDGGRASAALFRRLAEHAKSIEQTRSLRLSDFKCRYLVVVPVWITLAERFLIGHFRPVWNVCLDGFGNHAVGRGRNEMKRPRWDTLHPGRPWADKLEIGETPDELARAVADHLSTRK